MSLSKSPPAMNSPIKQLKEANGRLIEVEKRSAALGREDVGITKLIRKLHKEINRLERRSAKSARACAAHTRGKEELNELLGRHYAEHEAQCIANAIKVRDFCSEVDEFCRQADELDELERRLRHVEESNRADGIELERSRSSRSTSERHILFSQYSYQIEPGPTRAVLSLRRILECSDFWAASARL